MPRNPTVAVEDRDWMTTPEVAEVFDVATATIRSWVNKGHLATIKINGYNRIPKNEVHRFAKEKFGLEGEW